MVNYRPLLKYLSILSDSWVTIKMTDEENTITFMRKAKQLGSVDAIRVTHEVTLTHEEIDVLGNKGYYQLAMDNKAIIHQKVVDQEAGKNPSMCCRNSQFSSGWHHHTSCPNYRMVE